MKKLKIVNLLAIIIPMVIVGILVFNYSYSNNSDNNVILDGVEISNISFEQNNGITKYNGTVTATKDININYIKITVNDDVLIGYIGKSLSNGDSTNISATIDKELLDINNVKYEIK